MRLFPSSSAQTSRRQGACFPLQRFYRRHPLVFTTLLSIPLSLFLLLFLLPLYYSSSTAAISAESQDTVRYSHVFVDAADDDESGNFDVLAGSTSYFSLDSNEEVRSMTDDDLLFNSLRSHSDWEFLDSSGLSIDHMDSWRRSKLVLLVITRRRLYSLRRLCDSLVSARYVGASDVDIVFNLEADSDVETIRFVDGFEWPHGRKTIRQRVVKGGLLAAITECWYPASDDEYGIILEDDIEVSPLYYIWSKLSLLKYRYHDPPNSLTDRIVGISLYTPRVQELNIPRVRIDPYKRYMDAGKFENTPFRWQLPCSWGAIYYPDRWREFVSYIRARHLNTTHTMRLLPGNITDAFPDFPSARYDVFIPNSRSNVWKFSWKKYMIELMSLHSYTMIYPSYRNQSSFSTNHLEPGIHIHEKSKVRERIDEFRVPLMSEDDARNYKKKTSRPFFHFDFPPLLKLPVMNQFAKTTTQSQVLESVYSVVIHPLK